MNLTSAANINHLWANLLIEELIRCGIEYFCISPGSRSSALTIAAASNPKAKQMIHFDERGSAFHALGYTTAKRDGCAIITTSGTAVANLFPAIIEASKKKLPLIILTADRPPELRYTGAHQTIDQVKIFGEYVRWQFDLPCPTKDINPTFTLTTIDQAVHQAKKNPSGPVHINCMFREPLAPSKLKNNFENYTKPLKEWAISNAPFTRYSSSKTSQIFFDHIVKKIERIKKGIIVVGKLPDQETQKSVIQLAAKLAWPIFPDVTSGLRLGQTDPSIIHLFDQILLSKPVQNKYQPDGVLHLGGRITSKRWYEYIESTNPKEYIMVLNHPLRNDPLHNVTERIQAPIKLASDSLRKKIKQRKATQFSSTFQKINRTTDQMMKELLETKNTLSEATVARLITQEISSAQALFLSSSLPIRMVDMFGAINGKTVTIGSNRGASGIDGTIASAVGFSTGLNKPVTLLIGDLAFLYDLNSLTMLKELKTPMTIVTLNNNGGGIFSYLPISQYEQFEKYFTTPHNIPSFEHAGELFNLKYKEVQTIQEFKVSYRQAQSSKKSTIIEIKTSRSQNVQIQQEIKTQLKNII